MEIFIMIFACVRNYVRAKAKKLNGGLWALYTFIAFVAAMFVGAMISVVIMFLRNPELGRLTAKPDFDRDAVIEIIKNNGILMPEIFIIICGMGGYLLVRHLIIKKTVSAG